MSNQKTHMVDLMGQYKKIKDKIDKEIISTIESGRFVNGPIVKEFSDNLSKYLNVKHLMMLISMLVTNVCKVMIFILIMDSAF